MFRNLHRTTIGLALATAVAALFAAAPAASARPTAEETRNRTLVAQKFEAWRNGTGGPYDLLAEDARWTITGNSLAAKAYPSREAFMSEVVRPFNGRMSTPLSPSVRRLYAEGDKVVAFFDAAGVARDGKPYENTYAWFLRMRDRADRRGPRLLRQPGLRRPLASRRA